MSVEETTKFYPRKPGLKTDQENNAMSPETVFCDSVLQDQKNEDVDASSQGASVIVDVKSKLEESRTKRLHEETDSFVSQDAAGCDLRDLRTVLDDGHPAAKKNRLDEMKSCSPNQVSKKKQDALGSSKFIEAAAPETSNKLARPHKTTVKKMKKVTASKYVRKPQYAVGLNKNEQCLDSKNGEKRATVKNSIDSISLQQTCTSPGTSCSLSITKAIEKISTGEEIRILKTVPTADLTVYLVMAVITTQEFSDSDICKWIIRSKRTKYTGFNEKFGRQFDAYKVLFNIIHSNSDTKNGNELLAIVKRTQYKTPKKLNGWFLVFDEIPALLQNVSLTAGIKEQSKIIKYFQHKKDQSASKQQNTDFANTVECESLIKAGVEKKFENLELKKFIDRLEAVLKLAIDRGVSIEERMEIIVEKLLAKNHPNRTDRSNQKLELRACEDLELLNSGHRSKIELSSIDKEIDLRLQCVEGAEPRDGDMLEVLNSKVRTLEAHNQHIEEQLQYQKVMLDVLNHQLSHVRMRYFSEMKGGLFEPKPSPLTNSTNSCQTIKDLAQTALSNSASKLMDPRTMNRKECDVKCDSVLNELNGAALYFSESQHGNCPMTIIKDSKVEINAGKSNLIPPTTHDDSGHLIQSNFIHGKQILIEIPRPSSLNARISKRMNEIKQEILRAAPVSSVKTGGSRNQQSSLVAFKNLVSMLIEYEMLVDCDNSCEGGSVVSYAGRNFQSIFEGEWSKNCESCMKNKFMKSKCVKDEIISDSICTPTKTTVSTSCELHSSIDPSNDIDSPFDSLNRDYLQKEVPQVSECKFRTKKFDCQKTSELENFLEANLKQSEQGYDATCGTGSSEIQSGVPDYCEHTYLRPEREKTDGENKHGAAFNHSVSVCSKLNFLYIELYFWFNEDPSLVHPLKFISIGGMFPKIRALSSLFCKVLCNDREQNKSQNKSPDSCSTALSLIGCLTEEVISLYQMLNDFCDDEMQRKTSLVYLIDECDSLISTVLLTKEIISALRRRSNGNPNDQSKEIGPRYTDMNEGGRTAVDAHEIGVATLHKRLLAKEAKLREVQKELKREQYNRKLTETRLQQALTEIDQLVVVWDVLELRNDRSSPVQNETPHSSVSPREMRLLEQITGFTQSEGQPQSSQRANFYENRIFF